MKYLGIRIDKNLKWKQQISDIAINLNKANVILSNLRQLIDRKTLKSIYQTILKTSFTLFFTCLGRKTKFN